MRVHHIGYLVKNIEKTKEYFFTLGYSVEKDEKYDAVRDIKILFLINRGGVRIELIEPMKSSQIYFLLKKYKNSPYHICYSVHNLSEAIQELEDKHFFVIEQPEIAPCIDGKLVCFLSCGGIEIIELLEEKM